MTIALSVKTKLGFIEGSISKSACDDLNLLSSCLKNNNIVISWIMSSLSKDIYASIIFSDSAISLTLKIDFSKAMHLMSSNYI